MNKPSQRPTLADVARRAGVSTASASRVLRHENAMSERTRAQVLAAARALGYRAKARAPRRQAKESHPPGGLIALLITETLNPYFHEIVQGAQDEADRSDLLSLVLNSSTEIKRERQVLKTLAELALSGVILCAGQLATTTFLDFCGRERLPLVVLNRRVSHANVPCIVVDYETGACRATQHLLTLGHRRLAYLAGPSELEVSLARRHGIETALAAQKLELAPELCLAGLPHIDGGFRAMSNVLQIPRPERPTAVIAYNDLTAIGALKAVLAAGLRVPEDISIVGVDDIPMAAYTSPPLTTVALPKYQIGKLAVQTLLHVSMQQPAQGGYTLIEGSLIIRGSTAPAAS